MVAVTTDNEGDLCKKGKQGGTARKPLVPGSPKTVGERGFFIPLLAAVLSGGFYSEFFTQKGRTVVTADSLSLSFFFH